MKRGTQGKRRHERIGATLAVKLGGITGLTRDVSASGVFFETAADYHRGSRIHFEIDLDTPWGQAVCDCEGRIVRVVRRDGSVGIAVQFGALRRRKAVVRKKVRPKRGPRGKR